MALLEQVIRGGKNIDCLLSRLANEACQVMICISPTGYNGPVMSVGFLAPPL